MAWELVIFDNDGVLVDSETLANRVLAELLTASGYPTTLDDAVRRYMGGTIAAVRTKVEPELGRPLPADFEDRYHEGLFAGFQAGLEPVAGVPEVLDQLDRDRQPFCVASSGTHERIRTALKAVGLLDRFPEDHIFSAEDVAHGKPAPDLFLHAAASVGVDPPRCVVVEDSPAGVQAAKAAGMTAVGYAGMTPVERLAAGAPTSWSNRWSSCRACLGPTRRSVQGDGGALAGDGARGSSVAAGPRGDRRPAGGPEDG